MDKDETLWVESKLGLDSNSGLKSIPFANMTRPSLEEVLDKTNPRATNPWETWIIKHLMNVIGKE
jgi:hypothetical protein